MPRVIHLHLRPTPVQSTALQHTLETVNNARNLISAVAWYTGTFSARALGEFCDADLRERFGLSAAMMWRCVASVATHYQHDRLTRHTFRPHASIPYDHHTLRIAPTARTVRIWTLIGRQTISFVADERPLEHWRHPTLMVVSGSWYLLVIVPCPGAELVGDGSGGD